ncbi:hypothetical protein DAPPUDRAFT_330370 [Daphnia pulex]|uniref:Uncharacterized protein n=1 Tax=Daphnia pulex TaxID=6669 RepID=E9HJD7_DAPPU|nr:hypothetical protein DAPPUDRAFT_330370 [Daphnia pulex]|eukprot:EFX68161.1 hypothetical protein DAPPUDRAFT_330370 [Daphnia pulex]
MPSTSAASSVVQSTTRQGRNVEPAVTFPNNRLCVTNEKYPAKVTQSALQQQNRNVPNIATVTSVIRFYSLSSKVTFIHLVAQLTYKRQNQYHLSSLLSITSLFTTFFGKFPEDLMVDYNDAKNIHL